MRKSDLLENLNSRSHNLLVWLLALVLPFSVFAFSGVSAKKTDAVYTAETLTLNQDSTKLSDTELSNFTAKTSDDSTWSSFSGHAINVSTTDGKATLPIHVYNASGSTWATSTSAWAVGSGATSGCTTLFIGVYPVLLESISIVTTTVGITGTATENAHNFLMSASTGTNSIDESHTYSTGYAGGLISNGYTSLTTADATTTDTTRTITYNFAPLSGYTWLWVYLAKTTTTMSIDSITIKFSLGTSEKANDYTQGFEPMLNGATVGGSLTSNDKCYLFAAQATDTSGAASLCFLSLPYGTSTYTSKYLPISNSTDPLKITGLQMHNLAGCFFVVSPDDDTTPTGYYFTSCSAMLNLTKAAGASAISPADSVTNALFNFTYGTGTTYETLNVTLKDDTATSQLVYSVDSHSFIFGTIDNVHNFPVYPYQFSYAKASRSCAYAFSANFLNYVSPTDQVDVFRSLPKSERLLFAETTAVTLTSTPGKNLQDDLLSTRTAYLASFSNAASAFRAAAPVVTLDYETGRFVGLYADETYQFSAKATSSSTAVLTNVTPSSHDDNSVGFPFAFTNSGTVVYDATYSSLTIAIYDATASYMSDAVTLTIPTYLTAPTTLSSSTLTSVVAPAVGSDAEVTVDKIFNDAMELSVSDTASGNTLEYALVPSSTTYDDAWKTNTFYNWNSTPTFSKDNINGSTAFAASTSYDLYARYAAVYSGTSLTSMPTSPIKVGTYSTLSQADGNYRYAMLKSYSLYQAAVTSSGLSAHSAMDQICKDFYTGLSGSDAASYYSTYCGSGADYAVMTSVYTNSISKQNDLDAMAVDAAVVENSTVINSMIDTAITGITGYGVSELKTADSLSSAYLIYQTKLAGARYLVRSKESLIDYFNTSILPLMANFSNANRDTMWSALKTDLTTIQNVTLSGTSLDETKSAADAALASGKSDLDDQVVTVAGGKA
jgi:hypothetical protein